MLYLLNEGNKELENRRFVIPKGVKKHLLSTLKHYKGDKTVDGYKRLNNLVSMTDGVTYQEMKRLKNFFDHYNANTKSNEYILNGGDNMKYWVQRTLDVATNAVHDFKQAKKDSGVSNSFIRPHEKDRQNKKKNKPTQVKFTTNNMNRQMLDGNTLKYESILHESIDWEDYIYDYSPYYVLEEFWSTKNGTQNWGVLINPEMYQKALTEFTNYGKLMKFPSKYIYQWMGIIIKNSIILESNTALAGHHTYFPTDDFNDFIEKHFPEKLDSIDEIDEYDFLEELGLYDWMKMPDGSDAWSDFGLQPIFKLLRQYNDNSTPEETLVLINKVLDVYHQRGDLSSIFIQGGANTLSKISGTLSESTNKRIVITENQERFLMKEAQDATFSLDVLESLTSFKKRYQYCKQHLGPTIGRGSSRVIFQLSDEKCLKLALNGKGIAQNEQECRSKNDCDLFPEVFDNDFEYKYIVTEYVLPAKEEDFEHCLGVTFYQFCKFIASSAYYRHGKLPYFLKFKEDVYVNMLETNEDLYEWDEYIGNDYSIGFGDMLRLVNYGMTRRNGYDTIVLLDHGLNDEIFNKFYR